MKTVFLDESGELGFKLTSSNYFLITLLSCPLDYLRRLRNISKKIRMRKLKRKYKKLPELKGNNTSDEIRKAVLKRLNKLDIEIQTIILNKRKVYDYLKEKKHKIYNYISNLIISECPFSGNKVELIVDNRGGKLLAKDFSNYVERKFKEKNEDCYIAISHLDSKEDGGLQMVDFVSWAIFRKYEHGDSSFYNMIKDKITTEKRLFH